jgi:SNF2 family DNA or RNA helicase
MGAREPRRNDYAMTPLRYSFKTQPYAHQRRALGKIARLDGKAGVWMPMRTGKTKVAIDWAAIAFHNHGLRRVLIVCPISVIDVWRDEIVKHCPVPSATTILRATARQNAETMRGHMERTTPSIFSEGDGIHWLIVNYEMVWRNVSKSVRLDEIISRWKPDLVIADEAHKLKQYTSKQSKALARLGAAARMRLALTGTPITKWPLDAYGLFRFVDPTTFEQQKWQDFRRHYAEWAPARFNPLIEEVVRYTNTDELVGRVRAHSFSIRLEDAFPDLPERAPPQDIKVTLSAKARRMYTEMAEEMITELDSGAVATADIILTKLVRLSQITSGFIKDEHGVEVDIDDAKQRACMDLVRNIIEQDEKVVVACRFKHDYHRLSQSLTTQGVGHAMLTGETPQAERTANIARFRDDPACPVFIAQMQSGSLGIDLSAARLLIFYSLGYNWAEYAQMSDRILNPRKPRPLGIYRLLATNTVDMVQRRVLDERGSMAGAIIHSPRSLLDGT